jgi:hypothetical protein
MMHITLTEEQMRTLDCDSEQVNVLDPQGRLLGTLRAFSPVELEVIERHRRRKESGASKQPGIPSAQVQALLRKFHELDERNELDDAKIQELLRRSQAGEPL